MEHISTGSSSSSYPALIDFSCWAGNVCLCAMGLSEDHECGVCYERYSRSKHVPRVLFCNHTFCGPCLETMATQRSGMLSVRCPLCRQVSCVRRGLSLEEALWVNSRLWDHIQEAQELEVKEEDLEKECKEEKRKSDVAEAVSPVQPQW